jgi:hypothetical protein
MPPRERGPRHKRPFQQRPLFDRGRRRHWRRFWRRGGVLFGTPVTPLVFCLASLFRFAAMFFVRVLVFCQNWASWFEIGRDLSSVAKREQDQYTRLHRGAVTTQSSNARN